ncbi:uncharacterized protein TNCV_4667841 [Trichonephila clavipes]|nr:uncharacterized protein TNCV_4667841 [Trichonephila clavipes]
MRRILITEDTKCLLWFGGHHVDNFVHGGKADISKLGVSSSFQANFDHSLNSGYEEKNEKGYTLFWTRWHKVFVPPLPRDLMELIRNEFAAIARNMLV